MTRTLVLPWAALLLLLAAEALGGRWFGFGLFTPLLGCAMAALVATQFMHIGDGPGLVRISACFGLFWLAILLVLGLMDPMTRLDHPVPLANSTAR